MKMRLQLKLAATMLVASYCFGVGQTGAMAASPAASQSQTHNPADDVNVLENRFFFRLYTRDPLEKRLERLELLVFGGTQAGTNEERIARLKKTVKDRDTASTAPIKPKTSEEQGEGFDQESPPPPEAKSGAGGHGAGSSSTQYPILNTLEWRALKKTYPKESIDQRLERLETKLFGASSPAMAYADRVERLKRTLGVGVAQNVPSGPAGPMGPMPKARPRGSDLFEGLPAPGTIEPFGQGAAPLSPFGMIPGFSDMFKQLEQQMEQLRQMPSGTWEWDPDSGSWVDRRNGRHLKPGPGQTPQDILPSNPFPAVPDQVSPFPVNPRPLKKTPVIPPYDDPNSI